MSMTFWFHEVLQTAIIRQITEKKKMTYQSTYSLLQTPHPQISNKSQNLLAVDYPIILQTSGFLTNTNIYDNALKYSSYRQALEFIIAQSAGAVEYTDCTSAEG